MRYEFSALLPGELERIYALPTDVRSRLNLVIDEYGITSGSDGSSNSLTSRNDRQILNLLRARADIVIVGANSVRHEGWHIPQHGELIVISRGTLTDLPACPRPDRVRVLSYDSAVEYAAEKSAWILEGGKSIASQMLRDNLIDQLCLSLRCETKPPVDEKNISLPSWIAESSVVTFDLENVIVDADMLFTLWRRGITP